MSGAGRRRIAIASLVIFIVAAIASGHGLDAYGLWISETCHILIAAVIIAVTYRRFQFTLTTYLTLLVFALIVFTGAHYTYALVPLGEWMRGAFGFARNHFDRLGHFFQGAAPALFVRELLIRRLSLRRGPAVFWIVCGLCLGMAALFELAEWGYAMSKGGPIVDDLGAQGDPWDAQPDRLMALLGAAVSQLILARLQDREIATMSMVTSPAGSSTSERRRA
jgi:putative membrane protein